MCFTCNWTKTAITIGVFFSENIFTWKVSSVISSRNVGVDVCDKMLKFCTFEMLGTIFLLRSAADLTAILTLSLSLFHYISSKWYHKPSTRTILFDKGSLVSRSPRFSHAIQFLRSLHLSLVQFRSSNAYILGSMLKTNIGSIHVVLPLQVCQINSVVEWSQQVFYWLLWLLGEHV